MRLQMLRGSPTRSPPRRSARSSGRSPRRSNGSAPCCSSFVRRRSTATGWSRRSGSISSTRRRPRAGPSRCTTSSTDEPDADLAALLYRIAQEAVVNARKHAAGDVRPDRGRVSAADGVDRPRDRRRASGSVPDLHVRAGAGPSRAVHDGRARGARRRLGARAQRAGRRARRSSAGSRSDIAAGDPGLAAVASDASDSRRARLVAKRRVDREARRRVEVVEPRRVQREADLAAGLRSWSARRPARRTSRPAARRPAAAAPRPPRRSPRMISSVGTGGASTRNRTFTSEPSSSVTSRAPRSWAASSSRHSRASSMSEGRIPRITVCLSVAPRARRRRTGSRIRRTQRRRRRPSPRRGSSAASR